MQTCGQRHPGAISIHAPPRGATVSVRQGCAAVSYFNSRPSARGDSKTAEKKGGRKFQFTPLREGRPTSTVKPDGSSNFNSRPSARGDHAGAQEDGQRHISIHAPPRGATIAIHVSRRFEAFQFTPLREGRRRKHTFLVIGNSYFNSRPSARGDLRLNAQLTGGGHISIHAPPRGATRRRATTRLHHSHFNSRPSARGDPQSSGRMCAPMPFQFTPLREGRPLTMGAMMSATP